MHPPRRPVGLFVGLATLDAVYRVERAPGPDEKVRALSQELVAGGPAANAAVTYAALGGAATLGTALGAHPLAALAADDLAAHGVRLLDASPRSTAPPAVATAVVVDATGERSVVSVGAASSTVAPPAALEEAAHAADVLLLDGHHPGLALPAARAARAGGALVVLDAGSWKPALDELLPLVDVAACSAGFRVPGSRTVEESVRGLRERGVGRVAVTQGASPVLWCDGDDAGEVPVAAVAARDTLGAGDAFHGALALALAAAPQALLPFAASIELAARVASLRCTHVGQRSWLQAPELPVIAAEIAAGSHR